MNKISFFWTIVLALLLQHCMPHAPETVEKYEPPKTILHPKPLGNGGVITRDLFRSFWILPEQDSDPIRVGIIPSAKTIRLRAPHHFTIRVYGEHESFDVASPGGVTWEFEFESIIRPPVLRYLVTVEEASVQHPKDLSSATVQKWADLGFEQAQWIGPPKMDSWNDDEKLKRYFLTLYVEQDRAKAEEDCKQQVGQKLFKPCKVITRMDLPHLAKGVFRAQQSNFEKEFEGVIEIIPSKKDAIDIFDVKTSLLSDATETLQYRPSIFVVPTLENTLALVQSTTLSEYLKSVVPSEIFPEAPIEALKAQAVIARTYAFQSKDHYSDKPFLTCASTLCQVYLGEKTKGKGKYVSKAVEQTQNIVLKETGGFFAETFYHGSSGGKTEVKQWVLGGAPKSYLVGTNDIIDGRNIDLKNNENVDLFLHSDAPTYCSISRFSKGTNWSYHFDQQEINAMLDKIHLQPPLRSIEVVQRGFSGRALVLKIKSAKDQKLIHGELQIRSLFGGLPSSLAIFQPQMSGGSVKALTILGRGSGHGVGLSQMGAIGRALEGQNYKDILQSYYPGTVLTSIER
jgi:SpoIID/LytB domain protein